MGQGDKNNAVQEQNQPQVQPQVQPQNQPQVQPQPVPQSDKIQFDEDTFVQYMQSARYQAFLVQIQHMLEDNVYLKEDGERAPGEGPAEEEGALPTIVNIATKAIGNILAEKVTNALAANDDNNDDNDGDGDEEVAESTASKVNSICSFADPILQAVGETLVEKMDPTDRATQANVEAKLTKMYQYLQPILPYFQSASNLVEPSIKALLKKLPGTSELLSAEETKAVQASLANQIKKIKQQVNDSRRNVQHDRYNRVTDRKLYLKWKNSPIPEAERKPDNFVSPGGHGTNHEQTHRFEKMMSDMTKKDCLNQLVNNLNMLQNIGIIDPNGVSEGQLDNKRLAYQAFRNINYLYFQYNHLMLDTVDQFNYEYDKGNDSYNKDAWRTNKNGQIDFFVMGKFLQDANDFSTINVQKERDNFADAKEQYEVAREDFHAVSSKLIKEKTQDYEIDPDVLKETVDDTYTQERDITWLPSAQAEGGVPANAQFLKDKVKGAETWNAKNPDNKIKIKIHASEFLGNPEFLATQTVADPEKPGQTKTIPSGLEVMQAQIKANIERENQIYASALEKERKAIEEECDKDYSTRKTLKESTYNTLNSFYLNEKQKLENLGISTGNKTEDELKFDNHLQEFMGSRVDSSSQEEVEKVKKIVQTEKGTEDFIVGGIKSVLEGRRQSLKNEIESRTVVSEQLRNDIETKQNLINLWEQRKTSASNLTAQLIEQKTQNEAKINLLEAYMREDKEPIFRVFSAEDFPKNVLEAADYGEAFLDLTELATRKETVKNALFEKMFNDSMDGTGKISKKGTNYGNIESSLNDLADARDSFCNEISTYFHDMWPTLYPDKKTAVGRSPFRELEKIKKLDIREKNLREKFASGNNLQDLAGSLLSYKALGEDFENIYQAFSIELGSHLNMFNARKAKEKMDVLYQKFQKFSDSLSAFKPIQIGTDPKTQQPIMNDTATLEKICNMESDANKKRDTLFQKIPLKLESLKNANKNLEKNIASLDKNTFDQAQNADLADAGIQQIKQEKAVLEAKLHDREAEIGYLKQADGLIKEQLQLKEAQVGKYGSNFASVEALRTRERELNSLKSEIEHMGTENEKTKEMLKQEELVKTRITFKGIAEKHNEKLAKLDAASATLEQIKLDAQPMKDALDNLSAKGTVLGKSRDALDNKINPVLEDRKRLQARKQADFDVWQKRVFDAVKTSKKFMNIGDSQLFKNIKTQMEEFEGRHSGNKNVTDKGYFVSAQEFYDKSEHLLDAIDKYLEEKDVGEDRKWTSKGQHRLDSVKELKEVLLARIASLECYEAENRDIQGADSSVKPKHMFELVVQSNLAQNKNQKVFRKEDIQANPNVPAKPANRSKAQLQPDDMVDDFNDVKEKAQFVKENFPLTIKAFGKKPGTLKFIQKMARDNRIEVAARNREAQNVPQNQGPEAQQEPQQIAPANPGSQNPPVAENQVQQNVLGGPH